MAFRDPTTKGAHLLTVEVQVPGGADRTIAEVQEEALEKAQQVLRAAAAYCEGRTPDQLKEASEKQLIATSKPT